MWKIPVGGVFIAAGLAAFIPLAIDHGIPAWVILSCAISLIVIGVGILWWDVQSRVKIPRAAAKLPVPVSITSAREDFEPLQEIERELGISRPLPKLFYIRVENQGQPLTAFRVQVANIKPYSRDQHRLPCHLDLGGGRTRTNLAQGEQLEVLLFRHDPHHDQDNFEVCCHGGGFKYYNRTREIDEAYQKGKSRFFLVPAKITLRLMADGHATQDVELSLHTPWDRDPNEGGSAEYLEYEISRILNPF